MRVLECGFARSFADHDASIGKVFKILGKECRVGHSESFGEGIDRVPVAHRA